MQFVIFLLNLIFSLIFLLIANNVGKWFCFCSAVKEEVWQCKDLIKAWRSSMPFVIKWS